MSTQLWWLASTRYQSDLRRESRPWTDQRVRWRTDGGPWREEAVTCIAVCNGRYFGGGMMVAPEARIDDGLFDVTVWQGLGITDFLVLLGAWGFSKSCLILSNPWTFPKQ